MAVGARQGKGAISFTGLGKSCPLFGSARYLRSHLLSAVSGHELCEECLEAKLRRLQRTEGEPRPWWTE